MEYKPNPELERLKAEKEKNEKEIEQLDHKITRLENRQKYYEDGERKRPPIVSAPSQELWKVSHRRSRNWTSPM